MNGGWVFFLMSLGSQQIEVAFITDIFIPVSAFQAGRNRYEHDTVL